jgi:uncharacterized protein YabE (DUF348 family)
MVRLLGFHHRAKISDEKRIWTRKEAEVMIVQEREERWVWTDQSNYDMFLQ